jgi:ABC-type molybdate transport system ATPase subunit
VDRQYIATYREGVVYSRSIGSQATVGWRGLAQDLPVSAGYDGNDNETLPYTKGGVAGQPSRETIVFVSHSPEDVKSICNRACVLDRGSVVFLGTAAEAIERYHQLLAQ